MRLIRLKEVMEITGLGRSSIYKFISEGAFPQSISLGERAVAWELSEVEEWISIKIEERTNNNKGEPKKNLTSFVTEADVISFINNKFKGSNVSEAIAWLIGLFNS
ncbi:AlpA family transcriptional regulator [Thalassotalea sp. SU-HH00458]|uniref:AlpA family transcriptional regulator n=1 Tax=Thalassotalea sp. SU-HH00458 TaxID=3127657 RepID=UPI003104FAC1